MCRYILYKMEKKVKTFLKLSLISANFVDDQREVVRINNNLAINKNLK